MSVHVFAATDQDFERSVIERSKTVPVVVDFWAPWCGPCRVIGPVLERLADEFAGAFVLAKVNTDENQELSQAFRIQSIPMVLGLRDGRVVAEFVGAVPEAAVRDFLQRLLPSSAELAASEAAALLAAGQLPAAEEAAQRALQQDARCGEALLVRAKIAAQNGDLDAAEQLLQQVPPGPLRAEADRHAAELRVRQAGSGEEEPLRKKVEQDPNDVDARFQLAQVMAAGDRYEEALSHYLEIVRRDRAFGDDAARKAMIDIFNVLGSGNEVVERYRSELAKVLFS